MSRGRGTKKRVFTEMPDALESFDGVILEEVKQLFSKVRQYSAPPGTEWCLPDPSVVLCDRPWSHPPLQALKDSLNEVKNQLSDKDLPVWHQHTCSTNRAGIVTSHLRETANAELCTQAWAKFYEIQGTFKLLPDTALQNCELNSVHLCEAPGAFISALNHFLQTSRLHCDWTWAANTLNPYHEANARSCTIADDRLIAHTLPWWFFGSDNTGDIMLQKHMLELQIFVSNMRSVDLVTADGSFDCQGDPGEQENLVAPLQYCETVCALLLLAPGGSFVLKMFTLFEHSSICLLYLLVCCFRLVHVFKPATSKAGNSEVYIVCLSFKSKDIVRPLLSKLIRNYGPDMLSTAALFPKSCISNSFLKQHEEICTFFQGLQISTIQENLHLFTSMTAEQRRHLDQVRACAAQFYVQRFQVQPLSRRRWVCRGGSMAWGKPCQRKPMGSFNQRKEMQCKEWKQRLAHGPYQALIKEHFHAEEGYDFALTGPVPECDLNAWFGLVGATLQKVRSSAFCESEILDLLNEALEEFTLVMKEEPLATPACRSCFTRTSSPAFTLNKLCSYPLVSSCMVMVGNSSWQDINLPENKLQFCPGPSYPELCVSALHDGDPLHQRELLSSVFSALCRLAEGSSLVVPLSTALTRFTASLVLALHLCFQSITFHCLVGGPPVVLLCVGFTSVPQINTVLQEVLDQMRTLEPGRQILQFAPMAELTRGSLPQFLSSLNNTVLRQQLHLLLALQKKK
ncbi:cap-specific mRNA (nucleoside-2'-O-)-methyltransferase 2 [Silurus meridionalis]|nr:cap-specific mRNA (nucleoside-2'-O-)-methyltransferase 2 [Silurus meridionalis]XP_046714228.1 cap-specific mRNA (nucleoside-2'-O-)-methyltransferase 2 [Silurus meridionalis]XP_046714229.1 cap-specific mRNA (nucleoside-2'-O-)-methyltransferase 2 [Silurus meridionalis]XP_046714230.1 cap-specific mRNA (nucleoside-2'-O-)-methyltransferase 2 [Silurus meridionalis]